MIGIGPRASALEIRRRTQWRGQRRTARIIGASALLGFVFLLLAPWQQNAIGTGEVIAFSPNERALSVQAPIKGRVIRWFFQEGDEVEAGDVIVELADNDPRVLQRYAAEVDAVERQIEAATASIEALTARLESLQQVRELTVAAATAQIEQAENQASAATLKLEAAEAKQEAAVLQLERMEALTAQGLNSQRDLELARRNAAQARAGTLEARAAVQAARAQVEARKAERTSRASALDARMESVRDELEAARAKRSRSEETMARVSRAAARQNSLMVRAPRTGMLLRVRAREHSAFVKQGEELAVVVPQTDRRAVELFVSGIDAPLVVPGQQARLQFQGWPAIQLGGWPKAAVGTFAGRVAFVDAQATRQGRFRVVVVPDGDSEWPPAKLLRQGNRVNGWVLMKRVSLGYELWRQLNGFPPALPPETAEAGNIGKNKPE